MDFEAAKVSAKAIRSRIMTFNAKTSNDVHGLLGPLYIIFADKCTPINFHIRDSFYLTISHPSNSRSVMSIRQ